MVDGDTLVVQGERYRLFGIDSPEKDQTCDDGAWLPGPLAAAALEQLIAGRPVTCQTVARDAYGRAIARCEAGGDDLSALMVGAGWAWADPRSPSHYRDAERRAAARGRGIHVHRCQRPDQWRRHQRQLNLK